MKANKLAGLKPETVFAWFEKICSIPHGSYNTKGISDYIVSFARERGLSYIQDAEDNVIIFKAGSAGYQDHEPLILQGHMDMVCQKEEGSAVDMAKDPLDVTHDGKYVFARGTSLGADDGIAVAFILAILDDDTLAHPPLEVIFTTGEEVGMIGARAIDVSMLRGRRMLNLDMLCDNVFTAGCAGGSRVSIELPVVKAAYTGQQLQIVLENLHGGHSGGMIKFNHANANKAMAALLKKLQQYTRLRLTDFSGGTALNAIPRSCCVTLAADGLNTEDIAAFCRSYLEEMKKNYEEPLAAITCTLIPEETTQALTVEATEKVIELMMELPNGLQAWSQEMPGLVQTSLNVGVVQMKKMLQIQAHIRSSVNRERQELQDRFKTIGESYGGTYSEEGIYSAWEYRKDSPLRDTMVRLYQKRFGKVPAVRVIHAGLECGILSEKIPGLDCVSIGPNALDIHTSREKLDINSTEQVWSFLLDILKDL